MPSRTARLHMPIVKVIGRRLAAAETPEQVRRVVKVASSTFTPTRGVSKQRVTLGGVGALRVTPKDGPTVDRTVLFFHGGGYVFGSPGMYRTLAGRIAKAASATVDVPDYRLAPEHPHPAAAEDGLAAYRATLDRVAPERLVVAGDSAGGGLSVAVLQAARRAGLPMPAGLVLLSPWLDLRGSAADRANAADEMLILPPTVDRAARWYAGPHHLDEPGISPILGDLTGFPATLVQVSSSELLLSDSRAFVDRAEAAGVEVVVEQADGMWHVWQLMAPAVPEARESITSIGRFVAGCTD